MTNEEKISKMADAFKTIMECVGDDLNRPGLQKTPIRAAKAYFELLGGDRESIDDIVNDALFPTQLSEMVVVDELSFNSFCEHHVLPFRGRVHIGYIPRGQLLGLSKFARIVDYFSKRPQVQEELTAQIAECLEKVTGARGVGVVIKASHDCLEFRGAQKKGAVMTTSCLKGNFFEPQTRKEFFDITKK